MHNKRRKNQLPHKMGGVTGGAGKNYPFYGFIKKLMVRYRGPSAAFQSIRERDLKIFLL